jgi:hypothetical protein
MSTNIKIINVQTSIMQNLSIIIQITGAILYFAFCINVIKLIINQIKNH